MSKRLIPPSAAGILAWTHNAITQLGTYGPLAVGLTEAQATQWNAKVDAFQQLYDLCNDPTSRTPARVAAKQEARADLVSFSRAMIRHIQGFNGTTNAIREAFMITVGKQNASPIPKPTSSPALSVAKVSGRMVTVNLRERLDDGNPSDRRARPEGVKGAALFYATGDAPPVAAEGWTFRGNTSTTTTTIEIPASVPAGANVWLSAQWFNPRLQTGPACPAVLTSVTNTGDLRMAA